jgi:toxin ParE1/3/4
VSERPFRVILLPRAKRDIKTLWFDIAYDNFAAADKFIAKIDARVLSLSKFPERGVLRDDLKKGLRMLVEGKYLIFYLVHAGRVEIVHVTHGAQDLTRHFR